MQPANIIAHWRPIAEADRTITDCKVLDLGDGQTMPISNSDHYWLRDEDGRVFEGVWTDHKGGYWWDFEAESPVDPVEFLPHPLDSRFAQTERHPDDIAVDTFVGVMAAAMKAKLAAKRAQGFGGWNDPALCSVETLSGMLRKHVAKGDPVDVANLAMMIHYHGAAILPIDDATNFDNADHYWRDIDPEDCGNHPQEALSKGYVGHYTVCAVSSSYHGPTRFGFSAPVLDPESDDEEFLHFATEAEALAAAQERCAVIEARDNKCPVCNEIMQPDDLCATDVSLGICHAECLEGAPVVDLDTGEQIDAPMHTYRYGDLP